MEVRKDGRYNYGDDNWNDTTFEVIANWTASGTDVPGDVADYPVLDPQLEEFIEQMEHNETIMNGTLTTAATTNSGNGYTFTNRHVAMSVVPHFTGLLSLVGSALIVWDIYRKRYSDRAGITGTTTTATTSVYERLLFGLAASDVIASAGMALSTWPVPKYQAQQTWGALGTVQSCEFQGFIIQLGLATPLYSAALAVYYVLLVKFNYRPDSVQVQRFEKCSHILANGLAILTAIVCLALKQYNNANIWCWIAPYPYGCEDTGKCERGNHATIFRLAFYFVWLWISFITVAVSMMLLAHTVVAQTTKMDRYLPKGQKRNKAQTDLVRDVTIQSSLYILAFVVTAVPLSVARIYQAKYSCSSTFFPLSITTVTVFPMQGFWNAIIYFRTRFTKHLTEQKLGKQMTSMLSTRLSMSTAMCSKGGFSQSIRSLGSNSHHKESSTNANTSESSLRDLFGGGRSPTDLQTSSTRVTASSQANTTASLAGSSDFALDMSDTSDDGDLGSPSWSIADIQQQVKAMKQETKNDHINNDDDNNNNNNNNNNSEDDKGQENTRMKEMFEADGSGRLLHQSHAYLTTQNQEEEEEVDWNEKYWGSLLKYKAGRKSHEGEEEEDRQQRDQFEDETHTISDLEMDGSQGLLDYDAYREKSKARATAT